MSVFHYHSETLKCLNHPDGVHYSQDVDVCNICLINVSTDYPPAVLNEIDIIASEYIILPDSFGIIKGFSFTLTGRSPPFLVKYPRFFKPILLNQI